MRKKAQGGDMMMIITFTFIVVVMGTLLAIGVGMFFGSEYDFREVDANILLYKIEKCIANENIDFSLSEKEFEKEFFEKCELNKNSTEKNFLVFISLGEDDKLKYKTGDEKLCALSERNEDFPLCKTGKIVKNVGEEQLTINLITGSDQKTRKKLT
ncbi:MAG: hypothetical protein KJ600_02240 [Nanoarchaeota archaeon]|nr:hypothetical protein [Nanoarchaeota archaeon]MBU1103354.1 hypothetical protein [Nanoarchaeota archaeon]